MKTDEVIVGKQVQGFHKNLSESLPFIDFDFEQARDDFFHYVYLEVPIIDTGRLTSMVMYFEVWLDAEETIRLHTFFDSPTHWSQIEKILHWTRSVEPGDVVKLQIGHFLYKKSKIDLSLSRYIIEKRGIGWIK